MLNPCELLAVPLNDLELILAVARFEMRCEVAHRM
jgi:hypothetical protein